MPKGICEVCGKETIVGETKSRYTKHDYMACKDCCFEGYETYDNYVECIANCFSYDRVNEKWKSNFESKILPIFNKTLDEFLKDVNDKFNSYDYEHWLNRALERKRRYEDYSENWRTAFKEYVLDRFGKTLEDFKGDLEEGLSN